MRDVLCYMHEANDDHAAGRGRCASSAGGEKTGQLDRRRRARGDRAPAPSAPHRGVIELLLDRRGIASGCVRARRRARGGSRRPARLRFRRLVLIVDAGPLYAAAATGDKHHERAVELLAGSARPLLVPALVVTEVSYLLSDRIGPHAELAFVRAVAAGELIVEPVLASEWHRISELTEQYLDLPLGVTDASVVSLAERH